MAITLTASHASCDGTSVPGSAAVHVTGGTGPYEYSWSCGEPLVTSCDSAWALGVPAGTCRVEIVDAGGCSLTEEVVIHPAGPVRLEVRATDLTCGQVSDGTATALPAGGTPPYSFVWSDPAAQTTATATGLAPGTYTVEVADSSIPDRCTLAASVVVGEPPADAFEVVASVDEPSICAGEQTRLRAVVLGDAAPADPRFHWSPALGLSDPGAADPLARPRVDTTYTVTVTDATGGGCQGSDSVEVSVIPLPAVRTGDDVTICRDALPAEVNLSVTGAGPDALYLWIPTVGLSDPSSASPVLSLDAGSTTETYTVTVTENGCASTARQTVTVGGTEPALQAGAAEVCAGAAVQLVATGGIGYRWQGDGSFSCLDCSNPFFEPAGEPGSVSTARVRITDAFGCVVVLEQEVAVTGSLSVTAPDDLVVCPGTPVVLETTVSGDVDGPVEYLWSPAAGLSCTRCPSPTASLSRPTSYEVSVFAAGCSARDRVEIRLDEVFGASLSADASAEVPGLVRFFAEPAGTATTWRWDFGDGDRIEGRGAIPAPGLGDGRTTGSFARPVHAYQAAGRYQVCVTLEGRCGPHTVCELVTVEKVPCRACSAAGACVTCSAEEP